MLFLCLDFDWLKPNKDDGSRYLFRRKTIFDRIYDFSSSPLQIFKGNSLIYHRVYAATIPQQKYYVTSSTGQREVYTTGFYASRNLLLPVSGLFLSLSRCYYLCKCSGDLFLFFSQRLSIRLANCPEQFHFNNAIRSMTSTLHC